MPIVSHSRLPGEPRFRHSSVHLALTAAAAVALLAVTAFGARFVHPGAAAARGERARLVRALGLTDLCLFAEARYTRHPALADRHAAFQEHPGALEHFPSGSFVAPPPFLLNSR